MVRRIVLWLLTVCAIVSASGCMALNSADLLTLPEISPEHRELLKLINAVTASSDWSTTNPVAGDNKLTTQFVDFYNDGIPEALAFFRNPVDFRLRLAVYTKTGKSSYSELCTIEMAGEQFHRIDYADVNGDGRRELVVGVRYATSAMYGLNVYTLKNSEGALILDTTYTDLAIYDLTADGTADIITINSGEADANAYAELYALADTGFASLGTAPISAEVRTPSAIVTGSLNESMRSVIVEGSFTDSTGAMRYLSDVLICRDGVFSNLSYAELYRQSFETQRSVSLRFSDINLDGFLEFPIAISMPLPPNTAATAGGTCVRWFGYTVGGDVKAVADTYHASDNSWYFLLPETWNDRVYVRVESGEGYRAGVFEALTDGGAAALMTVYIFSSEAALANSDVIGLTAAIPTYNGICCAVAVTDAAELPEALADMALAREEVTERLVFVTADGAYRRAADVK